MTMMEDKENATRVLQQRQKIIQQELQQNPSHPTTWLQLITFKLALVNNDAKKCPGLGKEFEAARQTVSKDHYQHDDYVSLCIGNARLLMYVLTPLIIFK